MYRTAEMMPMAEPDGAKQRPCVARVQELPAAPRLLSEACPLVSRQAAQHDFCPWVGPKHKV